MTGTPRTLTRSGLVLGIALLDEGLLANNFRQDAASPVTLGSQPGNPVDRVTINGLCATDGYRAVMSVARCSLVAGDIRSVMGAAPIERLNRDGFKLPHGRGVTEPVITNNSAKPAPMP